MDVPPARPSEGTAAKKTMFNAAVNKVMTLDVNLSIAGWLRKRGKNSRPELNRSQRHELVECFRLIDTDGSGAIDAEELHEAFKVLGMKVSRREIEKMLGDADVDGTGEIEYPEFVQIMMTQLAQFEEADPNDIWAESPAVEYMRDRMGNRVPAPPPKPTAAQIQRKKEMERDRKRRKAKEEADRQASHRAELDELNARKQAIQERLIRFRSQRETASSRSLAGVSSSRDVGQHVDMPEDRPVGYLTSRKGKKSKEEEDEAMKRRVEEAPLPFQMMATAYRRRRFLEGVMYNQDDYRRKVVAKEEEAQKKLEAMEKEEGGGGARQPRLSLGAVLNQAPPEADEVEVDPETEGLLRKRMRRRASMAFSDGYMGEYDDGFTPPPELRAKGVGEETAFQKAGIHSLQGLISHAKMSEGKKMWSKGLNTMRTVAHQQQEEEEMRVQQRLQNARLMVRRKYREDAYLVDEGQWLLPEDVAPPEVKDAGGGGGRGGLLAMFGAKAGGGGGMASLLEAGLKAATPIKEEPSFELASAGAGGGGGAADVARLDLSGIQGQGAPPGRGELLRTVRPESRYKLYDPYEYPEGVTGGFHSPSMESARDLDPEGTELWERRGRPALTRQHLRLAAQGSVRALGDFIIMERAGDRPGESDVTPAGTAYFRAHDPRTAVSLPSLSPAPGGGYTPVGTPNRPRPGGPNRVRRPTAEVFAGSMSFAGPVPPVGPSPAPGGGGRSNRGSRASSPTRAGRAGQPSPVVRY